jgi:hypothetical protein
MQTIQTPTDAARFDRDERRAREIVGVFAEWALAMATRSPFPIEKEGRPNGKR